MTTHQPTHSEPAASCDMPDSAAGVLRRPDGSIVRPPARFQGRLGTRSFPAEPGRYQLFVSWGCSWSNRAAITRKLKGLEDIVPITYSDDDPAALRAVWDAMEPGHRAGVPTLWDTQNRVIVSNDADAISRDLATQFDEFATRNLDLYPAALRSEIDDTNEWLYDNIHSVIHILGHEAREDHHRELVTDSLHALAQLDRRLADRTYLNGDVLTESDVRLYVSLVRFECAYPGIFETNAHHPGGHPHLWAYARTLYAVPEFSSTTDFDVIRRNFAAAFTFLREHQVVPGGRPSRWT
ncbi:glutathione S-transferase C-terminal domain-containing protein [Rhodococcus jostii]|uniref:Glutathione S-transferase C-terminal domain-containing protein n=1 Tax=Rhodococcus jostii TaxID=132919 RepID=A0ABU4CT83_RHOJO|nr:glutathione S-transferase C-terminal domain-containing protein [Rhodococcus jostii]MDV6286797.1 glutathione S-transferase C-terminal domain-containing protein [Rhodococcus jostii]